MSLTYKILNRTIKDTRIQEYGSWMVVDLCSRRANRSKGSDKDDKVSANLQGSRFHALQDLRENELGNVQISKCGIIAKSKGKGSAVYDNPLGWVIQLWIVTMGRDLGRVDLLRPLRLSTGKAASLGTRLIGLAGPLLILLLIREWARLGMICFL
ncbi:hypothetical protein GOBAR_AA35758 [Gossypium barbadense]|uniref:Uncharacterized protein n=1 Tax=Gossypium barbadense TaxID=3634 RepID=A0A2P5W1I0_GOSBA|nr:hypothetical protein GOBAR_AA35758 [Gossypium barbadense]